MFNLLNKTITNSGIVEPGFTGSRIGWVISTAFSTASVIAFGVSFVMLAYAFIQFITSTGDPKRMEKPKSAITWSILGLILATLLQGIKDILLRTLGYDTGSFF